MKGPSAMDRKVKVRVAVRGVEESSWLPVRGFAVATCFAFTQYSTQYVQITDYRLQITDHLYNATY